MEQFHQKLSFLKDQLSLSSKELRSLLVKQGMLLNLSIEELKERIEFFKEGWHCSSTQLKELFISGQAKKIQLQSKEELTRMLHIYKKELGIKEEDLPSKLLDFKYYWYKYQKQKKLKESNYSPSNNQLNIVQAFFINNYNIKLDKNIIYRILQLNTVFINRKDDDHHKEVKEKIDYLSSALRLSIEDQELKTLLGYIPELLTNSLDELKQKAEYFNETLQSSFNESAKRDELKDFFLSRKVIVTQPIKVIYQQHEILSKGYELSIEGIRKILLSRRDSLSHLPEMMKDLEERKMILDYLFPSSKPFVMFPELLWISPERLYTAIDDVMEGGLASSVNDRSIQRTFSSAPLLLIKQKETIIKKIGIRFILLTQSNFIRQQATVKSKEIFKKALEHRTPLIVNYSSEFDSSLILPSNQNSLYPASIKKRQDKAFLLKDKDTQFITSFDEARARSVASKEQILLEICEMTRHSTVDDPYYDCMMTALRSNKIDLLHEGGCEEDCRKIEEGLRKGEKERYKEGMDLKLAMLMLRGKEIEKMRFSEEQARKIMRGSKLLLSDVSLIVEKLLLLTTMLHLNDEELISIIDRCPSLLDRCPKKNIFPKLEVLGKTALEYLNTRQEREELAQIRYLREIPESVTLEEAMVYYRNHPVIALLRKAVLRSPSIFTYSMKRLETVLARWQTGSLPWDMINSMITLYKPDESMNMGSDYSDLQL